MNYMWSYKKVFKKLNIGTCSGRSESPNTSDTGIRSVRVSLRGSLPIAIRVRSRDRRHWQQPNKRTTVTSIIELPEQHVGYKDTLSPNILWLH